MDNRTTTTTSQGLPAEQPFRSAAWQPWHESEWFQTWLKLAQRSYHGKIIEEVFRDEILH